MERPMYRYTETGSIHRESDGAFIPCDPANADFADLMMLGVEIAPFNADVSPFEDLAQAEHDEWLIETAARRALAALKQGYQDEASQGREQDQPAGSAGSGDLDSAVGDSGSAGVSGGDAAALELQLEDALTKDAGKLFPPAPDPLDLARQINARLLHKDDDLPPQAPSDWDMDGQGVVEGVEAAEPYVPDFTIIPDALAKFALADESAAEFRARLKGLWQRFGIEDGKNFPGGGEALTGEEKITMREIDIVLNSDEGRNASLLEWMLAGERRT